MTVGLCCSASVALVSLQPKDIGPLPLQPTVVSASLAAPPWENGLPISGVGPEGVAIPGLSVAPLVDSGTDLDDELSTPDDSPSTGAIRPQEVILPGVRHAPPDVLDLSWRRPFYRSLYCQ